jgi:hypothetical protein
MTVESELEQKILEHLDAGLQSVVSSGRFVIYDYLEKNFRLKREEIPKKPEIFRKGLTLIFGEEAADVIERGIIQKLRQSFDLERQSELTFAEAIVLIKAKQKKLSP